MFLDDGVHFLRYQIPDGLAFGNSRPYVCGRNIDPALVEGDIRMRRTICTPCHDDELDHVAEFIDTAPGMEGGEVILADKVEEIGLGMENTEVEDGIDGVGGAATEDLDLVDGEAFLALDGGADHCGAQLRRGSKAAELVWGEVIRHENQGVKVQGLERVAAEDKMAVVDGVECAPHDA